MSFCPAGFRTRVEANNNFCDIACSSDEYYNTQNSKCIGACTSDYTRVWQSISFCDLPASNNNNTNNANGSSYSASLQFSVRYDIPLSDFKSKDSLSKFIALLASVLGVESSQILILDIRSGSTIIDSEVVVTSTSDSKSVAEADAKVTTLSQQFNTAAQSNNLALDNVKVLNYQSTVITPSREQSTTKKKSMVGIVAGVVGGVTLIAVITTIYCVYQQKRKQAMRVNSEVTRIKANKVHVHGNENPLRNDPNATAQVFAPDGNWNRTQFDDQWNNSQQVWNNGQQTYWRDERSMVQMA
jgi:ribosomal silencing factor RsfS